MTTLHPVSMDSVVVGHSTRMRAVFEFLWIIASSDSTVLVTGESGTGKEVTATLIHQNSRRRSRPFVAVSCALFSETLIESELFGHERGAFTGAVKDRPGRFELAEGGTIFLDDIDDVPLSMQVKLLRVLQNRTVERLGGTRTISVNVRVIAGTKRDLKQLVAEGKFREDLFYRLNVLPVTLPPLRERPEDIAPLMEHFLRRFFRLRSASILFRTGVAESGAILPPAADAASAGSVASVAIPSVAPAAEPTTSRNCEMPKQVPAVTPPITSIPSAAIDAIPISLDDRLREVEASLITWALSVTAGNKSKAAELLKIKRSTLGDRINRCGMNLTEDVPVEALV
jgi:transcriptional regulator with GAF, ATPase, and Fis domain